MNIISRQDLPSYFLCMFTFSSIRSTLNINLHVQFNFSCCTIFAFSANSSIADANWYKQDMWLGNSSWNFVGLRKWKFQANLRCMASEQKSLVSSSRLDNIPNCKFFAKFINLFSFCEKKFHLWIIYEVDRFWGPFFLLPRILLPHAFQHETEQTIIDFLCKLGDVEQKQNSDIDHPLVWQTNNSSLAEKFFIQLSHLTNRLQIWNFWECVRTRPPSPSIQHHFFRLMSSRVLRLSHLWAAIKHNFIIVIYLEISISRYTVHEAHFHVVKQTKTL